MYWFTLFISLIIIVTGCTAKTPVPQRDFQPRPNYLTMGDPAAGRVAFLELKCNTCHTVAGETLAGNVSRLGGPELGSIEASRSPDEIARSIATPGHSISQKPGPWREGDAASMKDYARVMTVRQLMDLVAYIRSLPGRGDQSRVELPRTKAMPRLRARLEGGEKSETCLICITS